MLRWDSVWGGSPGEAGLLTTLTLPFPSSCVTRRMVQRAEQQREIPRINPQHGQLICWGQREEGNKQRDQVSAAITSKETCPAFPSRGRSLIKAYLKGGSMLHPEHIIFIVNL